MKSVLLDVLGIGGTAVGYSAPKMDFLKDGVSLIAGVCGIIFVIVSINQKLLEIKKMRKDAKRSENNIKED